MTTSFANFRAVVVLFVFLVHAARANQELGITNDENNFLPGDHGGSPRPNPSSYRSLAMPGEHVKQAPGAEKSARSLNPKARPPETPGFRESSVKTARNGAEDDFKQKAGPLEAGTQRWGSGFRSAGLRILRNVQNLVFGEGSGFAHRADQDGAKGHPAPREVAGKEQGSFLRAWPEADSRGRAEESEPSLAEANSGLRHQSRLARGRLGRSESNAGGSKGHLGSNLVKPGPPEPESSTIERGETRRRVSNNASGFRPGFRAESRAGFKPDPPVWPEQFYAQMFQNRSNNLAIVELYYDWPNGRNLNLIHRQLSHSLWDLEWTNGTSFYFDREAKSCSKVTFPVGILRPDWLDGAEFLGIEVINGGLFECYVWTKVDFITYYEDVKTRTPVRWRFHSGPFQSDVISFQPGKVLEDAKWQAPEYCF